MARFFLLVLSLLLAFPGFAGGSTIRVGAYTAKPGLLDPNLVRIERELGIRLDISELGGVDMLRAMEAGRLDAIFVAGSMENLLETAQKQGYPTKPIFEYHYCQVGEDELSVLVNPDVLTDASMLMAELNARTIRGLFTGRVRNWKEAGGPDMPVVVLRARQMHTTNNLFQKIAMQGEAFAADARIVDGSLNAFVETLSRTRGAIGIGPLPFVRSAKVWSPAQAMRIKRPFILVVSDRATPGTKKSLARLVDFLKRLSPEGDQ